MLSIRHSMEIYVTFNHHKDFLQIPWHIRQQIDWLFDNLDIETELNNRRFENLSGGNKRKICMSICVMGMPQIKLLD